MIGFACIHEFVSLQDSAVLFVLCCSMYGTLNSLAAGKEWTQTSTNSCMVFMTGSVFDSSVLGLNCFWLLRRTEE